MARLGVQQPSHLCAPGGNVLFQWPFLEQCLVLRGTFSVLVFERMCSRLPPQAGEMGSSWFLQSFGPHKKICLWTRQNWSCNLHIIRNGSVCRVWERTPLLRGKALIQFRFSWAFLLNSFSISGGNPAVSCSVQQRRCQRCCVWAAVLEQRVELRLCYYFWLLHNVCELRLFGNWN